MFQLHDISYSVKGKNLLKNVSCAFECGKISSIIGPNGAGKSTLLKVLSGMNKPTYGAVSYGHKNLNSYTEKELAVCRAYLNQQANSAFDFSVEEVVLIGRYPHIKYRPQAIDQKIIRKAMAVTGIEHLAQRSIVTLSGGELQRVHFARTLAQIWPDTVHKNPSRLLILDEPVNNLDPKHQHQLLETAQKLAKDHHFAVVAVLHDLNLALQYGDHLFALKNGLLLAQGPIKTTLNEALIEELYQIPASIFTDNSGTPHVVYGTKTTFQENTKQQNYEPTHL